MELVDLGEEEGLEEFKKATKTLLVDADTVVFAAASVCQYADDILAEEMYSTKEWEEIVTNPQYDATEGCIWEVDVDRVVEAATNRLLEIQEATETKDIVLYFTSGKNFRHEVHSMYKANRTGRYPPKLLECKQEMLKHFNGEICTNIEADDAVVYLKRTMPDKFVLAAVDKDVYRSVAGKHFNYYTSTKYNIGMKWVETTKEEAEIFPYIQCLTGDSTDNIRGCPGIGPKRALQILAKATTPRERWEAVVKAFESKKLTVKDAIRDMRLVNMHQVTRKDDGSWEWLPWTQPLI